MKINSKQVDNIITMAKKKFIDQPARMYWETPKGKPEIKFEEKRIIAILEAAAMELELNLEVEYDTRD